MPETIRKPMFWSLEGHAGLLSANTADGVPQPVATLTPQPASELSWSNSVANSPLRALAWLPGQGAEHASLDFGGWLWRYDLGQDGDDRTEVTLTYDWSAVSQNLREQIGFPPFDRQHLDNSLKHLAGPAQSRL